MKKNLLIVSAIILLAASCNQAAKNNQQKDNQNNQNQQSTSSSQNLPQGEKTGWNTYISPTKYGFEIKYPNDFGFNTDINKVRALSFVPACDDTTVACVFYAGDKYKGTNFDAAGVSINILKNLTTQSKCETMEGAQGVPVKINGETLSRFGNGGNAATGHFEEFQANRIFKNNLCYEVMLRMAYTNIDNYPPGTIKEFNKNEVWNGLEQIFSTFKFVQANPSMIGKQITVTGTTVCLPHRNVQPGQPQTLECAIGLKEEGTGKYYALKDAPEPIYDVNVRVQVTGVLQDDSKSIYDTVGAIKVSQITRPGK